MLLNLMTWLVMQAGPVHIILPKGCTASPLGCLPMEPAKVRPKKAKAPPQTVKVHPRPQPQKKRAPVARSPQPHR